MIFWDAKLRVGALKDVSKYSTDFEEIVFVLGRQKLQAVSVYRVADPHYLQIELSSANDSAGQSVEAQRDEARHIAEELRDSEFDFDDHESFEAQQEALALWRKENPLPWENK